MKHLVATAMFTGAMLFVPNKAEAQCQVYYHGPTQVSGYYAPSYYPYTVYAPPVRYYPSNMYYGYYRPPVTRYHYISNGRRSRIYLNYRINNRYRWR